MTITYLDPEAACLVDAKPYTLRTELKPGATIGLVINQIVDCDRFMTEVGSALSEARQGLNIIPYSTGRITFADAPLMDQVARECDAAICAIGHCGSCTAGTVKDGIALIERGCPSVSLVTEVFWAQAAALARSLGWPGAPRVKLPYPVWGTGQQSMQTVASHACREILSLLEDNCAEGA